MIYQYQDIEEIHLINIAGEIEFGKKDKWGISLQAAYENAMKYGLRFNYKF